MQRVSAGPPAALLALAIALAIAGCGGGSDSGSGGGQTITSGGGVAATKEKPSGDTDPSGTAKAKQGTQKQAGKAKEHSASQVKKPSDDIVHRLAKSGAQVDADSPEARKILKSLKNGKGTKGKGKSSVAQSVKEIVAGHNPGSGSEGGGGSSGGGDGAHETTVSKILEQLQNQK